MLEGINIARALSCLLIAAFHTSAFLNAENYTVSFPFRQTPGIHVFMLLSGFLCARMARRDDTFVRFAIRRLARLLPLYWLLTTVAIAMALWRPWMLPGADLSWDGIVSSYLLLPHMDHLGRVQPILFVGWMVNLIVWLNLVFAASLHAPRWLQPFVLTGAIAALFGIGMLLPSPTWRAFLDSPLSFEFAAGVFLFGLIGAPVVERWCRARPMWPLAALGAVALVAAAMSDATGALRAALCGGAAALTAFGLIAHETYRAPITPNWLTWLGAISYSIYLVHPLVIPVVGDLILVAPFAVWEKICLMFVGTFAVVVLVSSVLHEIVEVRFNAWLRGKLRVSPKPDARAIVA